MAVIEFIYRHETHNCFLKKLISMYTLDQYHNQENCCNIHTSPLFCYLVQLWPVWIYSCNYWINDENWSNNTATKVKIYPSSVSASTRHVCEQSIREPKKQMKSVSVLKLTWLQFPNRICNVACMTQQMLIMCVNLL